MSDDSNGTAGDGGQQNSNDQSGLAGAGQAAGQGQQGAGAQGHDGQSASSGNQQQGGASATQMLDGTGKTTDSGAKGPWPENWRELMAEGDEKFLDTLKRYGSPLAFRDAYKEARKKLSERAQRPKLPDNPTEEQVKAYRAELGIPETPEGYDTSLGDGHVWGEADKPLLQSFTKAAHDANVPPEHVKPLLKWYEGLQQQQLEARQNADASWKKQNVDELREEWGADYRMELRIVDEFFETLPDGLGEVLLNARDADGRPLGANAKFIRWANRMQREANPLATVLPGSGVNSMQAMEAELDKLRKLMGDRESEYWKGPSAAKNQARYRELLDAKERLGKKAA